MRERGLRAGVVVRRLRGRGKQFRTDRAGLRQSQHRGLDPAAGGVEPGVVRGVRVGGHRGEAAYLTCAEVEQYEHLPGARLASP